MMTKVKFRWRLNVISILTSFSIIIIIGNMQKKLAKIGFVVPEIV